MKARLLTLLVALLSLALVLPAPDGEVALVQGRFEDDGATYKDIPEGVYAVLGQRVWIANFDKETIQECVIVESENEPFYYVIEVN